MSAEGGGGGGDLFGGGGGGTDFGGGGGKGGGTAGGGEDFFGSTGSSGKGSGGGGSDMGEGGGGPWSNPGPVESYNTGSYYGTETGGIPGLGNGSNGGNAYTSLNNGVGGAGSTVGEFVANPTGAMPGGGTDTSLSSWLSGVQNPGEWMLEGVNTDQWTNPATAAATGINPGAAGSVFETGAAPLDYLATGNPGATSASALAAPSGVGGSPDLTALANPLTASGSGSGASSSGGSGSSAGGNSGNALGGMGSMLGSNPLGTAIAGAGLLNNLLNGNPNQSNQGQLNANAQQAQAQSAQLYAQGQELLQHLQNGTLPPGYAAQIEQGIASARARIISRHAESGRPTDPRRNSVLAAELAQAEQQAPILAAQIATQLASTGQGLVNSGLSASGLSSNIYNQLVNQQNQQNQQTQQAITAFAGALNGQKPK